MQDVRGYAVRLQLHALAYNLGSFLRTPATLDPIKGWSLTSLKEKLIKIGAKVVSHGRYRGRHSKADVPGDSAADRGNCGLKSSEKCVFIYFRIIM